MSKLIYVAIIGASAGIAASLREACIEAGLEVGSKSFTEVELHTIPMQVVDNIGTVDVKDDDGEVTGKLVNVVYRGAYNTLAAQTLRKHMHRVEVVKVKLLKGSTTITMDEEDGEESAEPSLPPPPSK